MWGRLPVWLRAIATGLLVSAVPTIIWVLLVVTNLRATPRVPWAAPLMAAVLWLLWRRVRGDERLRMVALPPRAWRLALASGGLAVAALWATFGALRGLLNLPTPPNDLDRLPLYVIVASILMGSVV